MRRIARVDDNQVEIVKALRAVGATVQPLHAVGDGCPDLLVGFRQKNYLIEVKDGSKSPSRQVLTHDQRQWHAMWAGQRHVARDIHEALHIIGGGNDQ